MKNKTGKYQMLRRIKRKLMKMFCKYFFSHRIFYSLIESEYEYQELLIKNSENEKRKFVDDFYKNAIRFNIDYSFVETKYNYPFKKIKTLLKNKDLVLINLETPLTRNSRARGYFISDPHYAQAMKDAGISIVSLANNHIFDAGEVGFLETMQQLHDSGISYTGAGRSLEEARLGKLVQLNGVKIIFLSYTQW
ncbi:CapA family protein, partial [bacterium]|nr:CapA family protein [bacterium]